MARQRQRQGAAFYAYAFPEPEGYSQSVFQPANAFYNSGTGGCILMYDLVRKSNTPDADVRNFFKSTYEACANLGHWNREELEQKNAFHPQKKDFQQAS